MARKAEPGDAVTTRPDGQEGPTATSSLEAPPLPEQAATGPVRVAAALPPDPTEPESRPYEPVLDLRAEALSEEGLGAVPFPTAAGEPNTGVADDGRDAAAPELGWGAEPLLAFRADPPADAAEPPPSGAWTAPPAGVVGTTPSSSPPALAPLAPARRGGFGGALLGGLVAASLGFGAAWVARERLGPPVASAEFEERLAELEARPQPEPADLDPLVQRLTEAEARLAALEEAPATTPLAESAPALDVSPLSERLEALSARLEGELSDAEERAGVFEERLAALEARAAEPEREAAPMETPNQDAGPALVASLAASEAPSLEPRLAAVEAASAAARVAVDELDQRLAEIAAQARQGQAALADLEPRVVSVESAAGELAARLEEVEATDLAPRVEAVETATGELTARLEEVEATGSAAAEEARAAAAALAESQTRAAEAEAAARRTAALARIEAALAAGQPFDAPVADLGSDAPDALTRAAAEGVPSVAALREAFPEAARAGLERARAEGVAADGGGVTGFLWGQLSVRSTAPREGDDPDAVLSRAEAALAAGRLEEALAEVASLPEPVQAAMGAWVAQARARAEVQAALAALRDGEPAPAPAD